LNSGLARQVLYPLSCTPNPFVLQLFFQIESCIFPWASSDQDPFTYASCRAWITGTSHPAYWLRWGLADFLLRLTSELNPRPPEYLVIIHTPPHVISNLSMTLGHYKLRTWDWGRRQEYQPAFAEAGLGTEPV
jgi:hypothetical protein